MGCWGQHDAGTAGQYDPFASALKQPPLLPNYFGDLVKKETGHTAQDYIQAKLIDVAKEKIFDGNKTINQIAGELGFKYPQHFARVFKKRVGQSPVEYRSMN
ncbi:helix-turn-helix transcriptional regulator [Mucilaginibacter jinjuensis]|uniref:helix-turn-helix domain-containing protein n=1 Tax=Mucilaginibacter jinjuensis TaxID=1176721 RepID=UPI003080A447